MSALGMLGYRRCVSFPTLRVEVGKDDARGIEVMGRKITGVAFSRQRNFCAEEFPVTFSV